MQAITAITAVTPLAFPPPPRLQSPTVPLPVASLPRETVGPGPALTARLPAGRRALATPPVIGVLGLAAAGEEVSATTVAIVNGFSAAGMRVAVVAIAPRRCNAVHEALEDAGAQSVRWVGAADDGACTYPVSGSGQEVARQIELARRQDAEVVVAGVFHAQAPDGSAYASTVAPAGGGWWFGGELDRVLLCAADRPTALAGVAWLTLHDATVAAVSGPITAKPAQTRTLRTTLGLPVLTRHCLEAPFIATALLPTHG